MPGCAASCPNHLPHPQRRQRLGHSTPPNGLHQRGRSDLRRRSQRLCGEERHGQNKSPGENPGGLAQRRPVRTSGAHQPRSKRT
eukprot:5526850-Amphidinium_carterae.1